MLYDPNKDLYKELGVSPKASDAEIKKAYRRLAKKHHPDISKEDGAEERFKAISNAYSILSNPDLRTDYNLARHNAGTSTGQKPPPRNGSSTTNPNPGAQPFWTTSGGQKPPPRSSGGYTGSGYTPPPPPPPTQPAWTSSPIPSQQQPTGMREIWSFLGKVFAVLGCIFLAMLLITAMNQPKPKTTTYVVIDQASGEVSTIVTAPSTSPSQSSSYATEQEAVNLLDEIQRDSKTLEDNLKTMEPCRAAYPDQNWCNEVALEKSAVELQKKVDRYKILTGKNPLPTT